MQIKRLESKQPIPENAKKVFQGVIFDVKDVKKVAELKLDAGEKIKLLPVTLDELVSIVADKNIYFTG